MLFAYVTTKSDNFIIVEVLSDEGVILFKKDFWSIPSAKKYLDKAFPGYEWDSRPWDNNLIKEAQAQYEQLHGIPYDGRCE